MPHRLESAEEGKDRRDIDIALLRKSTTDILTLCKEIKQDLAGLAEKNEGKFDDVDARCVKIEVEQARQERNVAWTQRIGGAILAGLSGLVTWKVK